LALISFPILQVGCHVSGLAAQCLRRWMYDQKINSVTPSQVLSSGYYFDVCGQVKHLSI